MTEQEIYEKVRQYFSKPDADFAFNTNYGQCLYRYEIKGKVRKCGIGCVIPPRMYDPVLEEIGTIQQIMLNTREAISTTPDNIFKLFSGVKLNFLIAIQKAHDDLATKELGKDGIPILIKRLDTVARRYKLKVVTDG